MRILVVSEGKHELNLNDNDPRNGPLIQLVDRVLSDCGVSTCPEYERRNVQDLPPRMMSFGKGANYERRAVAWVRQAQLDGFDAIVLMVDEDNDSERRKGIDAAQASILYSLPRAMGLAVKSFDAWMLADEQAISKAISKTVQRQKDPETLKDPKQVLHDLIDGTIEPRTTVYLWIAEHSSLGILRERCPKGFLPFHDRLVTLASSVAIQE